MLEPTTSWFTAGRSISWANWAVGDSVLDNLVKHTCHAVIVLYIMNINNQPSANRVVPIVWNQVRIVIMHLSHFLDVHK